MNIDIWSDVRCPFCYIGKRKFEDALEKFSYKNEVKVNWHSFELDPSLETNTEINSIEHISRVKGISKQQGLEMHKHVINMAEEVGLNFDFEKSVVANSFNAHRLIQFAKSQGKGNEVEEELFKAYFTDGKNIDDKNILTQIGITIGLDEKSIKKMLDSDAFADEVRNDERQAQSIGISGVPFFVLNNKYGISGAQPSETFLDALEQTWEEIKKGNPQLIVTEGAVCSTDGNCN